MAHDLQKLLADLAPYYGKVSSELPFHDNEVVNDPWPVRNRIIQPNMVRGIMLPNKERMKNGIVIPNTNNCQNYPRTMKVFKLSCCVPEKGEEGYHWYADELRRRFDPLLCGMVFDGPFVKCKPQCWDEYLFEEGNVTFVDIHAQWIVEEYVPAPEREELPQRDTYHEMMAEHADRVMAQPKDENAGAPAIIIPRQHRSAG